MPQLSEVRQLERRGIFLDAAERCFARVGFNNASLQEIAAEAESSTGSLYSHFASKSDLSAQVASRILERFIEKASSIDDQARPVAPSILMRRLFESMSSDAILSRLLIEIWSESASDSDFRARTNDALEKSTYLMRTTVKDWLTLHGEQLELTLSRSERITQAIVGFSMAFAVQSVVVESFNRSEFIDFAISAVRLDAEQCA